ncbi:MAG: hypothetical protein DRO15_07695 [Thermoprotei archaeon]|nr:MAG: hypothetical protein DRO15_07695 [Thermoprotei archaeon]
MVNTIVIDTTYLLPIFGIGIKLKDFEKLFPKLINMYRVLYNPISIIEAKWIVMRLIRRNPGLRYKLLERFRVGLKTLYAEEKIEQTQLTNYDIEEIADVLLLKVGVKDYFDRVIYATAAHYKTPLLTEDEELRKILSINSIPKPPRIINWDEVIKLIT